MMSNTHNFESTSNTWLSEPPAKHNGFSISNSLKGIAICENKGNIRWSQLIIVEPGSSADLKWSLKKRLRKRPSNKSSQHSNHFRMAEWKEHMSTCLHMPGGERKHVHTDIYTCNEGGKRVLKNIWKFAEIQNNLWLICHNCMDKKTRHFSKYLVLCSMKENKYYKVLS